MNAIKGSQLAGASLSRMKIEGDYYATPSECTRALLAKEEIIYPALEPACGEGHIAKLLEGEVTATDLINRGYGAGGVDFLTHGFPKYPTVITNPPFSLFTDFVIRGLEIATHKLILFGKLNMLEGQKRAAILEHSPLKTVYVFKARQSPWRNGSPVDENGKPWASTMAFAWFVWEKGYENKPNIQWI